MKSKLVFERVGEHSSTFIWENGTYLHVTKHVVPIRIPKSRPASRYKTAPRFDPIRRDKTDR